MFKKVLSPLLIAATLTAGMMKPAPAEAGIILTPLVLGVVILVVGLEEHNLGLTILGQDGNLNRDQLAAKIQAQYNLEDPAVAQQFADAINAKAAATPVATNGTKTISLSQDEVMSILAPTGLDVLNPSLVQQMVTDFGPNS
jgi:hypothetical protein